MTSEFMLHRHLGYHPRLEKKYPRKFITVVVFNVATCRYPNFCWLSCCSRRGKYYHLIKLSIDCNLPQAVYYTQAHVFLQSFSSAPSMPNRLTSLLMYSEPTSSSYS